MITILKSKFTSNGIDHRTEIAREVSVIVKGSPIKQVKVGVAEVKSNYNIENGFVRRYNPLEYGESDLTNTYANVEKNSYIHSINIDENFDATNITSTRLYRHGKHENLNSRLYTVYDTDAFYPNIGDWPSPIFLKTAQTTKNGNLLIIGTKGTLVKLYDNSSYSGDPVYLKEVDGNVTSIYNLLPKTTYYYRVLDSSNNILFSGSFTTEGNTRFTRLALVHNVRDCGGWKTIDRSKRFKYGLVFRGAEFDAFFNNPTSETLTNVANELKQLNIKLIINLRGNSYGANVTDAFNDVFGANGLTIHRIGLNEVGEDKVDFTNLYNTEKFQKCFFLALKALVEALLKNQSVYIHCQQGRDRTGGFMAILLALCDISENGIIKDYELTSSCTEVTVRKYFYDMWTGFKNGYSNSTYPTIQSKILKWFIEKYDDLDDLNDTTYIIKDSNGNLITSGQTALNTIRELLLEDVPLKDMTVGIIGDSYSAYHTWKPVLTYPFDSYVFPPSKEDSLYYGEFPCRGTRTDVRDNVKSVDLMWWHIATSNLGMIPEELVSLAAWSGTCVSDIRYISKLLDNNYTVLHTRELTNSTIDTDPYVASSAIRIKHLSNKFNGNAPDIIICEIGMNDARRIYNSTYGTIIKKVYDLNENEKSEIGVYRVKGDPTVMVTANYIKPYYKFMLDNIIALYPKSKIFCMTPVNVSEGYVANFTTWKTTLTNLLNNYPQVTLIDVSDAYTESGVINTGKYTIDDDTHPNIAGNIAIANIVTDTIRNYYSNLLPEPEPEPQEDDVYITQINDDSFTGSPTINGGVFTWPLKVTLSDGTVTTYANYRSNHSNYGDATSLITGNNAKAPNEGYIDSNGNLTYDLSKDNYVLDSTYLGTVTLPCLTNSSNTVTKDFSKIQKCASSSTPFDSYISSKYDFTTVTGWNLSYHMSSSSDPDKGKILISTWPQVELEDINAAYCTIAIPTDCIIRVTHSTSSEAPANYIGVVNTSTKLTRTGVQSDANIFTNDNTDAYSRGKSYTKDNNLKSIAVGRGLKAYLRNTTTKTYSYLTTFCRYSIIEIGTLKTSS